ncbi:helix-turn-helix transcriptional regulator [Pseudoflavitalea sp. X16]|uniref:helix-turn-helix transcriptional regulator n=1 Tax=Paraflavitalea devenefica TaxID=2716334 RepID=UPI001422E1E8|nr:AraC family transcriptional regulator [Paraflavitalea devenefica]NII27258.1 helix-turn-helix transcriptional regulator [Paraflavitalea devenefica]
MNLILLTRENTEVTWSSAIPPSFARFSVPEAREGYATGDFGSLLFSEQAGPDFSCWHKAYFMKQSTWLFATADVPLFQLVVAMNRTMRFQQRGTAKVRLPEGQFNILYAPAAHNQIWFEKGKKYMIYDLHFSRSYLEKLMPHFSLVQEFLVKTELGFSCLLNSIHAHVTPEMMDILHNMLHCPYTGDVKSTYLQALLSKLLLLAVTRLTPIRVPVNEIKLQPYELAKLREAWEYLLQHLDRPGTVIALSHAIGLNDFKLKKGFKQLYGITIFEFLLEARMEKARRLLQETDMTVHAVAIGVGYKNISSFTVAFKKKFGILPSEVRE